MSCFGLFWFGFGGWEIVLVLAVVVILFGAKILPELARSLSKAVTQDHQDNSSPTFFIVLVVTLVAFWIGLTFYLFR